MGTKKGNFGGKMTKITEYIKAVGVCECVCVCVHVHTHAFMCTRNLCTYILLSLIHHFWSKRLLAYLIFIIIILP